MIIKSGIYQILNLVTNDKYIGRSGNIPHRFRIHKSELSKDKHGNYLLQEAWRTYGEDNFTFSIIEECSPEEAVGREQVHTDSGIYTHNISKSALRPHDLIRYMDADGNVKYKSKRMSDETKKKISDAHKKRVKTPEEIAQVRSLFQARIGRAVSPEERVRLKAIAPRGPAHPNFGKPASPERKVAIARANGTSVHCICGITGKITTFASVTQAARELHFSTEKIYATCMFNEKNHCHKEYKGYYLCFIKKRRD